MKQIAIPQMARNLKSEINIALTELSLNKFKHESLKMSNKKEWFTSGRKYNCKNTDCEYREYIIWRT